MASITTTQPRRVSLVLALTFALLLFATLWAASTVPASGAAPAAVPGRAFAAAPVQGTPAPADLQTPTNTATPTPYVIVDKVGPGSASGGSVFAYQIYLTNRSTTLTTTAALTDTLSTMTTWAGTSASTGITCSGTTTVVCQVSSLAPQQTKMVTITVSVNSGASGQLINYVISRAAIDTAPSTDTVSTSVLATTQPSATPTGAVSTPDAAECNNDFAHAYRVSAGQTALALNFVPPAAGSCGPLPIGQEDVDYFVVRAKRGDWFQATTSVVAGIDTYMRLYDQNFNLIAQNDDIGPGNYGSQVIWESGYDGDYFIQVTDVDPAQPRGATYTFDVDALVAGPTPLPTNTPLPGPTAVPGLDACEPNWDFDHACLVAPGSPRASMNFISQDPSAPDNDFYKLWQKPGLTYQCKTSSLSAGLDTNIIVYNQDGAGVGGNDDCAPGDFSSCVNWESAYTGWVYFLVGSVSDPPPAGATYTFECSATAPQTPTPLPTATARPPITFVPPPTQFPTPVPPPTQEPATPQPTLVPPTPTLAPVVIPLPTATVAGPPPSVVRVSLQVYYDANHNEAPDSGEGVIGVRAQLVDANGTVLDSRATGTNGIVELSAVVRGSVVLEVPYFGVRVTITEPRSTVQVRVVAPPFPGGVP